ncbi:hypothetical protein A2454_04630 [Candidatus Peribacteria bacterium RIFOXYC2_FULL_55_14]|nr:MAG: hypothetical protein A2198_01155 [Candidatus Peribacteria bacterium RIFOXYA1_FULL_56_14]OGJ74289.1 MAG: hypothetical protein A2384_06190 [Candidatus Peribacteria bacterium RIFOXYB1_FULL_54_35]OGJ75176.1 MAG: hypothetical protein A2217_05610 [Candidatus Peribacteria bacterium RIFOXYA2_FULL_55_28]OGJ75907.1 MAG: hypothetical protein A2327_03335 [Candidatus Peribacteria bacterium RIFOXYB2_FULL_54_17]OGJ77399.1 MAG: hypothetical protein A2424_03530 [Candidatus Peribacteria bacterium RIFOXYC
MAQYLIGDDHFITSVGTSEHSETSLLKRKLCSGIFFYDLLNLSTNKIHAWLLRQHAKRNEKSNGPKKDKDREKKKT